MNQMKVLARAAHAQEVIVHDIINDNAKAIQLLDRDPGDRSDARNMALSLLSENEEMLRQIKSFLQSLTEVE